MEGSLKVKLKVDRILPMIGNEGINTLFRCKVFIFSIFRCNDIFGIFNFLNYRLSNNTSRVIC